MRGNIKAVKNIKKPNSLTNISYEKTEKDFNFKYVKDFDSLTIECRYLTNDVLNDEDESVKDIKNDIKK